MRGTIVCGVTDSDEGRAALAAAVELSARLGLRLVLVHVAGGIAPLGLDGHESGTACAGGQEGTRLVARLAAEYGVTETTEQRSAVDDPAVQLAQIAAEEAADVIIIGARARGRLRRGFYGRLLPELDTETPVPVLIAPPRTRSVRHAAA